MTRDDQVDPAKALDDKMKSISINPPERAQSAANKVTSDILASSPNHPNVSSSDTCADQQQEPFHIVLIDIKKGADGKTCRVSKSLDDKSMKFVTISYRWGEVPEQVIDTGLGYAANITSFHLHDFQNLCKMLLNDSDLKSMEYVWMDAICVDQTNQARRKATIYQMSNIYERANFILAVPDLHLRYLMNSNTVNSKALYEINQYNDYIYRLIHCKFDYLLQKDEEWFTDRRISQDCVPHPNKIMVSLNNYLKRCKGDSNSIANDTFILEGAEHLYYFKDLIDLFENEDVTCDRCKPETCICTLERPSTSENVSIPKEELHCLQENLKKSRWARQTFKRGDEIQEAMMYLSELIKDWSSRVWVIREFQIAKNKSSRKLKYWFMSLCYELLPDDFQELGVFVFDFDDTSAQSQKKLARLLETNYYKDILLPVAMLAYDQLYVTMRHQLGQQSFLEMMLKSTSSKNEDRFYASLPTSDYRHNLESKDVVHSWRIDNTMLVKLKMYEFMSTKDKLVLLFVTALPRYRYKTVHALPLFAALDLDWSYIDALSDLTNGVDGINFDMDDDATLQLIRLNASDDNENGTSPRYKLNLRPAMFYIGHKSSMYDDDDEINDDLSEYLEEHVALLEILGIACKENIRYVRIPISISGSIPATEVFLCGSLEEKKWLIVNDSDIIDWLYERFERSKFYWEARDNRNGNVSFDIY